MLLGALWECKAGTAGIGPCCPPVGQHDGRHGADQLYTHGEVAAAPADNKVSCGKHVRYSVLHMGIHTPLCPLYHPTHSLFTRGCLFMVLNGLRAAFTCLSYAWSDERLHFVSSTKQSLLRCILYPNLNVKACRLAVGGSSGH